MSFNTLYSAFPILFVMNSINETIKVINNNYMFLNAAQQNICVTFASIKLNKKFIEFDLLLHDSRKYESKDED